MDWSNEKVIQFLEVFQMEPCLWDLRLKTHKNRGGHRSAWRRVLQALPFPATIEELKKKKETLMGYYRIHLKKYKQSLLSDAGEIYKTHWFAYDTMHSFLKPIYFDEKDKTPSFLHENVVEMVESDESEYLETNDHLQSPPSPVPSTSDFVLKKLTLENSVKEGKNDERVLLPSHSQRLDLDEYDHFAFMIAAKIRKINDADEREILMNTIQNIVFESMIKNNQHAKRTRRSLSLKNEADESS